MARLLIKKVNKYNAFEQEILSRYAHFAQDINPKNYSISSHTPTHL